MGKGKFKDKQSKKKYYGSAGGGGGQGFGHPFQGLDSAQGFLVTCNEVKERNAVNDVYNI
jgi:hypothetical protein